MIVKRNMYQCRKCVKIYSFDVSKEYSELCPKCGCKLEFELSYEGDTEIAEQNRKKAPYVPTWDDLKPDVTCPYCKSTNTHKISAVSKIGSAAIRGLFSSKARNQWHCKDCRSDF